MSVRRGAISSSRLNTPRPGYLSRDEGIIQIRFYTGADLFLSSSVLAVVNGITESHILLQKARAEDLALRQIMGEEFHFKPHYIDERIDYYKAYNSQDQSLAGFVLKTQAKGV